MWLSAFISPQMCTQKLGPQDKRVREMIAKASHMCTVEDSVTHFYKHLTTPERLPASMPSSVIRFGKNSPLWLILKDFGNLY